ncbi:MAG: septum formation initiator family protein [Pelotomaculum sp.]|nr:septum formation initiator family protein [Pelotomaculum sp.]
MTRPLRKEQEIVFLPVEREVPERRTARRRSFNFSRSRLPALVALLLLGYLAITFSSQFGRLSVLQKNVDSIQQEVQELKQKNAALREELQMVQSDAYIEKTAREKLGLVKPGETRVVPVPPGTQLKELETPSKSSIVGD